MADSLHHPGIDRLARGLALHTPRAIKAAGVANGAAAARASVAFVLQPRGRDLALLLIKRAARDGDPWAGHMALPGGRRESGDADALATALRETREEVGIDLRDGVLLGRLDDVRPRGGNRSIVVTPFVFAVPAGAIAIPNEEVEAAYWVAIEHLLSAESVTEYLHPLENGGSLRFPALGYQGHTIWGMTHRILEQFLDLARTASTHEPPDE